MKLALGLVLFFLGTGTLGYIVIDGYSPIDAFYMTVITISTVGYGEIQPLSHTGRIFTVFLILFGVGSIAFAAGAFTEIVIERAANPNRWVKAMEKKIDKLKGHIIICGHGRMGASAAQYFLKENADFVIIENSDDGISKLADLGYHYIKGDGTREEVLLRAGIKQASALLAALNSDPENLFTVLTARELNPVLRIIARTEETSSESRMLRAGADSVISPFVAAGQRVAESLLHKEILAREERVGDKAGLAPPDWTAVNADSELVGRSIEAVERMLNVLVVGLRRESMDIVLPDSGELIAAGDKLLAMQRAEIATVKLASQQSRKIVFIDDNPVILRLYTRLFQKAGFNVMTASTGQIGFDIVMKESPDAAVIDLHLPDMSGLAICRKIKASPGREHIKLFLFTADEQEDTKFLATKAGVEMVVVKSPNASEIVSTVLKHLS